MTDFALWERELADWFACSLADEWQRQLDAADGRMNADILRFIWRPNPNA